MIKIGEIENELTRVAKLSYEDIKPCKFYPLTNLEFGDIYSDFLIQIAKQYKKDTSEIYDEIQKNFSIDVDMSFQSDFLNIKFKSFDLKNYNEFLNYCSTREVVIFIPNFKDYSQSTFLRLCFKGMLQKSLFEKLNIKVNLYIGNSDKVENSKGFEAVKNLKNIFKENKNDEDILEIIGKINEENLSSQKILIPLGASTKYQRKLANEIFKNKENREKFILNFSSKDWSQIYKSEEDILPSFLAENLDSETLTSLSYILSSKKYFNELDIFASQNEEQDNFWYFFNSTLNRLEKLLENKNYKDVKEIYDGEIYFENENQRNIFVRAYFLKEVLYYALLQSRIEDFIEYADNLLKDINHFLNTPFFRNKILNGEISQIEQIVFDFVIVVFREFIK